MKPVRSLLALAICALTTTLVHSATSEAPTGAAAGAGGAPTTATIESQLTGMPTFIVEKEGPSDDTLVGDTTTGECYLFKVDLNRWANTSSPSLADFDRALQLQWRTNLSDQEREFIDQKLNDCDVFPYSPQIIGTATPSEAEIWFTPATA